VAGAVFGAAATWGLTGFLMPGLLFVFALALMFWPWVVYAKRMGRGRAAAGLASAFVVLAGSLQLSGLVHDVSFDGLQYHQQGALALASGWNPYRDPPYVGPHALWINGYAKGAWTWAALFPAVGLSVEFGKSINLILAAAGALCMFDLLHHRLGLTRGRAVLVAVTAAASPIVAMQWATFTNDCIIASLLLIFAARAVSLVQDAPRMRAWDLTALVSVLGFLPLVKGSGAAYGCLLWLVLLVALAWLRGKAAAWRWAWVGGLALAVGVLLLGFNPYVTNTLRHGHPLYPLAGPNKVDIITSNAPRGIMDEGRAVKLLGSVFSRSHSEFDPANTAAVPPALQLKIPGTVAASELRTFATKTDVRIGGLGPWFGLAFSLALVSLMFLVPLLRTRPYGRRVAAALYVPAAVLALSLAFPEPWWARYVPQLWLFPLSLAVVLWLLLPASRSATRLAWAIVLVAAVDAIVVASAAAAGSSLRELDHRTQLNSLEDIGRRVGPVVVDLGLTPALAHRLDTEGIRWRRAAADEGCAKEWLSIEYTGSRVCLTDAGRALFQVEAPLVSRLKRVFGRG